jgi:Uma2 family endonuclease
MSVQYVQPHRFTVDEFHRMAETGILAPDDRVELINGEIVEMTPVGPRHASRVRRIELWLHEMLGREAVVSGQSPVDLGFAEPYPDVSVARWRDDLYEEAHPTPAEVLLLIEVADSTVLFDRNVKSGMYAQAGIAEYWVVDLPRDSVAVFRSPQEKGYTDVREYSRGESFISPALGGREVRVEDVLGPAAS